MLKSSKLSGAVLAAAAVAGAASSASAADLGPYRPYQAPVVEAPFELAPIWEGAYVGINGGYGWSQSAADADGFIGGGQLGYNWQRGNVVFGIEGDIQASDLSDAQDFTYAGGFGRARSDIDWFSTVRGRIGIANGPTLFYLTGGVAFADIDTQIAAVDGGVPIAFSGSDTQTGYTVGGGLEYKLSQNWTMKAEYLYLDFGSDKIAGFDALGNRYTADVDTDAHVARLGVNYKF